MENGTINYKKDKNVFPWLYNGKRGIGEHRSEWKDHGWERQRYAARNGAGCFKTVSCRNVSGIDFDAEH